MFNKPPCSVISTIIFDCDSCGFAIGSVISQYQFNTECVIAYGSKTLNEAQRNYCTTKRELYSIVYFVQYFKYYLLGRRFIIRTDHAPLLWLCNFKNPSGILARWINILGAYEYEIKFRPGTQHGNADGMSRKPKRPCQFPDCEDCKLGAEKTRIENTSLGPQTDSPSASCQILSPIAEASTNTDGEGELEPNWLPVWTSEQLQEMQSHDLSISELVRLKQQYDQKPLKEQIRPLHKDIISLWNQWEILYLERGILYRKQ